LRAQPTGALRLGEFPLTAGRSGRTNGGLFVPESPDGADGAKIAAKVAIKIAARQASNVSLIGFMSPPPAKRLGLNSSHKTAKAGGKVITRIGPERHPGITGLQTD